MVCSNKWKLCYYWRKEKIIVPPEVLIFLKEIAMERGESVSRETYTTQTQKITVSDAASNDEFGYSVATSGNYAIVGAIESNGVGGSYGGTAYIFEINSDGTWGESVSGQTYRTETKKLTS